ncbi:MAG: mechanosensitive ion channel family protein [Spirulina sp. SIO3F2]|nr:mechanosensitive ion channel family protein [Spirulina sp. SIO3F2]
MMRDYHPKLELSKILGLVRYATLTHPISIVLRFIIALGLGLFLSVGLVWNQFSLAQITGLDLAVEDITAAPHIPTVQLGDLEVAPVFLDGRVVLSVASAINPIATDDRAARVPPAAFRSQQISQRLHLMVARLTAYSRTELVELDDLDAQAKQLASELVIVSQRSRNDEGVSYRLKIAFPKTAPPEPIVTLTELDARYTGQALDELPQLWREQLVESLLMAWRSRQPLVLWSLAGRAALHLAVTIALSLLMIWGQQQLRNRQQRQQQPPPSETVSEEINAGSRPWAVLRTQLQRLNRLRDRNLNHFLRRSCFWGQIVLWVVSLGWVSRLFYFSRPFANWLLGVSPREWFWSLGQQGVVGTPIQLLLVFLGINLSERLISLLIERLAREWLRNQVDRRSATARFPLRVPTLVSAAQGVTRVIAYSIFILLVLNQFRAIAAPLTALLGIITFAISLGAQNFIRDVINGILILLEDQYAVGDVIAVNGDVAGLVEDVNLRITQLRNLDGELITIPNGTIGIVRNMTSEWSQAKCSITVSHQSDVEQAMALMVDVAQALYADAAWRDRVLDQPELLGIEHINHHGSEILILLKAQPIHHWDVAREYRRRLSVAFAQAGIEFGFPRQGVVLSKGIGHLAYDS